MTTKIYPLLFKSGIKRDNTNFQAEYITSGDFIRWNSSYLNRMEGMSNVQLGYELYTTEWNVYPPLLYFYIDVNGLGIDVYQFWGSSTGNSGINRTTYDDLALASKGGVLDVAQDVLVITKDTLPQVTAMNYRTTKDSVTTPERRLIFYLGNNLQNINNPIGSEKAFYTIAPSENKLQPMKLKLPEGIVSSQLSGGVLAQGDYLFIYGSNGSVLISSSTDSSNFVNTLGKSNTDGYHLESITHDKLIYAATTRGGGIGSDCSLLFWSLSSLVLVTSQKPDPNETYGADNAKVTQLTWTTNTISSSCSILSSRSVVECDGLFYWVGTDRFFVYNGMVQNLTNNMNQNYFFDNVDMAKRQLVYGVLNSKYKEIWWFYPEKVNSSNDYEPNTQCMCTHAIVYNINDQTWYDVALTGSHAQYLPSLGQWYNCGIPRGYPHDYSYLWKMNSLQKDMIITKPGLSNVYTPLIPLSTYSNQGTSDDNAGGGDVANLIDGNYLTRFTQDKAGGNIVFDFWIEPIELAYISIVSNHVTITTKYSLTISWIDDIGRVKTKPLMNLELAPNKTKWIMMMPDGVMTNCSQLRLQFTGELPFSASNISLWTKSPLETPTVTVPLVSYFTTPTMSFASFSPLKQNDGDDHFMSISRIEPDIKKVGPEDCKMSMVINDKEYAQSVPLQSMVYKFTGDTPRITMNYQARNVTFTITGDGFYEMGNWFFKAGVGAGQ